MNFLYKRSVLRRTPIFQEGGSNIFLGEAKPYDVAVPIAGPSSNPSIANKPIEINTTGIADQINKQKDLSYKWAELQFRYKDLEFKEGKEYLDALRDVYKSLGSADDMIKSIGGVGSLGQYQQDSAAYLSEVSNIHSEASQALGRRDLTGFSNSVAKLSQAATSNANLKFKTTTLEKLLESARKGDMGYNTKRFMEAFYKHLNNETKEDGTPYTFDDVLNVGTYAMGVKTQSKDVTYKLDNVFNKYLEKPTSSEIGAEVQPWGGLKTTSKNYLPSLETLIEDLKNQLLMDDVGKDFLYSKGINPDNPNSQEMNDFLKSVLEPRYNLLKEKYPEYFDNYSGEVKVDVERDAQGRVRSIPKPGGGDKETEAEYKRRMRRGRYYDKYGPDFVELPEVKDIFANETDMDKADAKLEEVAKRLGLTEIGKKGNTGIVPGTDDLPNTLKGIEDKFFLTLDPEKTMIVDKDGTRYLVTNEAALIDELSVYKDILVAEDLWDTTFLGFGKGENVEEILGITEKERNTGIFSDNSKIYNLGPAPNASLEKVEGDDSFIKVDSSSPGVPRQTDFKQPVSSRLVRLSTPVLKDYGLWITDTSDSRHESKAQAIDKTSFDVNFEIEKGRPLGQLPSRQASAKIAKVIKGFSDQGLRAIYEVPNQKVKDSLLQQSKTNGWDITPEMILVVSKITGNHFSVYCDDCTPMPSGSTETAEDTGIEEGTNTPSTYGINPESGGMFVNDLIQKKIAKGEKVDISNQ